MKQQWIVYFILMHATASFAFSEYEPTVIKANSKSVLINTGVDPLEVDEIYIAYDRNDRRKAAIRITKVGATRAVGKIIKGKAMRGYVLERREREANRMPATFEYGHVELPKHINKRKPSTYHSIGLLGGSSANTMNMNIPGETEADSTPLAMSGETTEYHLYVDIGLSNDMSLMLSVGQQQFQAAGNVENQACSDSNDCLVDIKYLSTSAMLKYDFDLGQVSPWAAVGGGLLTPDDQQSSTNAFDEETIVSTGFVTGAVGLEWQMVSFMSLQAQARYSRVLNKTTEANILSVLSGLAFHF